MISSVLPAVSKPRHVRIGGKAGLHQAHGGGYVLTVVQYLEHLDAGRLHRVPEAPHPLQGVKGGQGPGDDDHLLPLRCLGASQELEHGLTGSSAEGVVSGPKIEVAASARGVGVMGDHRDADIQRPLYYRGHCLRVRGSQRQGVIPGGNPRLYSADLGRDVLYLGYPEGGLYIWELRIGSLHTDPHHVPVGVDALAQHPDLDRLSRKTTDHKPNSQKQP